MDIKIGIIGGTGVADPDIFRPLNEKTVKTEFGKPSDKVRIIEIEGKEVAFLPRHGTKHTIPPHMVNYRANIAALRKLGVERVIGLTAVGSLRKEMKPGDVVIPDQFIDMTKKRALTFYEGPKVVHISTADPFCPELRKIVTEKAKQIVSECHEDGTYICIEGPRFSTRAESALWRQMDADVIGMTLVPEAQLAREMEMCYLSLSTVTDYDVWADRPVNIKEVVRTMKKNTENVQKILKSLIPSMPSGRTCPCSRALENAVM